MTVGHPFFVYILAHLKSNILIIKHFHILLAALVQQAESIMR